MMDLVDAAGHGRGPEIAGTIMAKFVAAQSREACLACHRAFRQCCATTSGVSSPSGLSEQVVDLLDSIEVRGTLRRRAAPLPAPLRYRGPLPVEALLLASR